MYGLLFVLRPGTTVSTEIPIGVELPPETTV